MGLNRLFYIFALGVWVIYDFASCSERELRVKWGICEMKLGLITGCATGVMKSGWNV